MGGKILNKNEHMKKLFLFSSIEFVIEDAIKHLGRQAKDMKVAFIDTASEVEKGSKKWLRADRQSQVEAGFQVTDYTLTGKNLDQLRTDLADFDIIYLAGGNTFYLLQQAQKSGFTEIISDLVCNKNKIYMGSSAGSIVAGPNIWPVHELDNPQDAPDLAGYEGFKLADVVVLPHWGSPHFKDAYLSKNLPAEYSDTQWPLLILTDHQYILVENDTYQIIDTTQRPPK